MTTLQPELQSFRHELRAAVEADLVRHRDHRRHLRRAVALGTPAGLAALGLSLALVLGAGSTPSPADAAILASAQGALTPPPDSVFHVAATITVGSSPAQPYALWAAGSSYRFIKFGYEAAWNGTTMSSYDAASNTMYVGIYSPPNHPPVDTAATIRSLISSGQAHVAGSAVVDGVPAYVLSLSGQPSGSGIANATYDVAKSDYHPLLLQGTTGVSAGTVLRDRAVPDLRVPARDSGQSLPARSERTTPRRDRGERGRSPRCWDIFR